MQYRVIINVKAQKGVCAAGHKVGDRCVFEGLKMNGHVCPSAFDVLYRFIYAMKFGAEFPWAKKDDSDMITVACPDAENPVIFELRREKIEKCAQLRA